MEQSGLRARKRERARRDIEAAAARLFSERGVEAVRMADIAGDAMVSEATLYNYYANKAALVEIWGRRRLCGALAAALPSAAAARGARRLGRDVAAAIAGVAEEGRDWLDAVWGGLSLPEPGRSRAGAAALAPRELVARFREAQEAGEIRADLAPDELADLLLSVVEGRLRAWLGGDPAAASAATLEVSVRRAVDVVMDGCRKRHERVRASAAVRPVAPPASS